MLAFDDFILKPDREWRLASVMQCGKRMLDTFLAPVVAGLVVGWQKHNFEWWCRLCEPWPELRWASRDELVIWIDTRGIPRSGIETMHVVDEESCELMATIDYGKEDDGWTRSPWTLEAAHG
jgi:hypothetical protein